MARKKFDYRKILSLVLVLALLLLAACTSAPSPTTTTTSTSTTTPTTPTTTPSTTPTTTPTTTATSTTTTTPTPSPTTTPAQSPSPVTVSLTANNLAFNLSLIPVQAGAAVTINFDNQDAGIPHNFALYTNSSASTPIFVGQLVTGPATVKYTFAAPTTPGTYFFRCDVHPDMSGSFIVQ